MDKNKELKKTLCALTGTGWFLICMGIATILMAWHIYAGLHQMTINNLELLKKESPNLLYGLFWSLIETYKLGFQMTIAVSGLSVCFGAYILDLRKKLRRLIREETN